MKIQRIPAFDPRLGRHVHHEDQSRHFSLPIESPPRQDVQHATHGPTLDQNGFGACTGFSMIQCLNTDPFYSYRQKIGESLLGYREAMEIYARATRLDPWPGAFPPDDTGSSPLAAMKAARQAGLIREHRWAFGIEAVLGAIAHTPLCVGTIWRESMSHPNRNGLVKPSGGIAGGHAYLLSGYQIVSKRISKNLFWFRNSWSISWGLIGGFCMTVGDFEKLLNADGEACRPVMPAP